MSRSFAEQLRYHDTLKHFPIPYGNINILEATEDPNQTIAHVELDK